MRRSFHVCLELILGFILRRGYLGEVPVLVLDGGGDEDESNDICAMLVHEEPGTQPAQRMGNQDVRAADVCGLERTREVVDDRLGRAWLGASVAEAVARAILAARARFLRQRCLDLAPR